eukprot:TRINITY_DN10971_c0_g1_i1.p1 TRINITY_DN10971_c0_g1~~TRINITY_DN10971_c0_g1_i1.p1  ORF type:complete len:213 (+),score=41.31 TRINITY_DN10971_c0_g1_i1:14-652(+)
MRSAAFILSVLISSVACHAIYMKMNSGESKCFIEDLPEDTLLRAFFNITTLDRSVPRGVEVKTEVEDPQGNILISLSSAPIGQHVEFTSKESGEHKICFSPSTSASWFGKDPEYLFFLNMDYGADAVDYGEVAQKEHLSSLQIVLKEATNRAEDIRKEQSYLRSREERFHHTSESTNRRVLIWGVLQILALGGCAAAQILHLRSFFKAKKLV